MTIANLTCRRSEILIDFLVNKLLLTEIRIGLRRENNPFALGLAEFKVEHPGEDDLYTNRKSSLKFRRYFQSKEDMRGRRVQVIVKCRHGGVQEACTRKRGRWIERR